MVLSGAAAYYIVFDLFCFGFFCSVALCYLSLFFVIGTGIFFLISDGNIKVLFTEC